MSTREIYSKDIVALRIYDQIDQYFIPKIKILWGSDGETFDPTLDTPFPVFPRKSTGTHTRPEVSGTSSEILAANPNRTIAIITNNEGFTAYLKLGTTAAVQEGIPLLPNEKFVINGLNYWTGSISAIKAGANSSYLDVFEA